MKYSTFRKQIDKRKCELPEFSHSTTMFPNPVFLGHNKTQVNPKCVQHRVTSAYNVCQDQYEQNGPLQYPLQNLPLTNH